MVRIHSCTLHLTGRENSGNLCSLCQKIRHQPWTTGQPGMVLESTHTVGLFQISIHRLHLVGYQPINTMYLAAISLINLLLYS